MQKWLLAALGIIGFQAFVLYLFGQPAICTCGYIKIWENVVLSPGNSQHLSDWYSFSHVVHGFIFYWLATLISPRLPWPARLAMAVGVEVAWEIFENTPMVISHYRLQALAQGYTGDSILNSVSDTFMMIAGFLLAVRLPAWAIILIAVGLETFTIYMIRDGLLLNIINFVAPFDFISKWQSGG